MAATGARPNLLIITADDLNADSTGWMGSKVGATPNIDALAASSHQFRNCHTVIPICQPSRSAFLTGRLPHRNGASGFGPVRGDVPTLTEVLAGHGYFTAAMNKIKHMAPPEKFRWDVALDGSGKEPGAMRADFEKCLRAAQASGKPFFINANSTDPHGPFPSESESESAFTESEIEVPSFLEDLPAVRRELAQYFSAVRRLDQTVCEILGALASAGRQEDTVVLFFADHGMSMPYSKATLYRNATWAPVLLRWPSTGTRIINTDTLSNIDIMPTILDLLELPKPDGMDGESWLPLIRGQIQSQPQFVFTQIDTVKSGRAFPSRCVRSKDRAYIWNEWADGKTKFRIGAMANRVSWRAIVEAAEQNEKLRSRVDHFIYRCPEEFYDETRDPDERENLISAPAHRDEIAQMKSLLLEHMERSSDPLLDNFRRFQTGGPKKSFWRSLGIG